jgi:cytosine deaminase
MNAGFAALPDAPAFRLLDASVPRCVMDAPALAADREGFARVDLTIAEGRIVSILAAGTATPEDGLPGLDMKRGIVFPRFTESHTHLDKGHIWPRRANPDGTFMGALTAVTADREANWHAADVRARMSFGLKSAFAIQSALSSASHGRSLPNCGPSGPAALPCRPHRCSASTMPSIPTTCAPCWQR